MAILAQYEQGIKVTDICREHGISQPTFTSGNGSIWAWKFQS